MNTCEVCGEDKIHYMLSYWVQDTVCSLKCAAKHSREIFVFFTIFIGLFTVSSSIITYGNLPAFLGAIGFFGPLLAFFLYTVYLGRPEPVSFDRTMSN